MKYIVFFIALFVLISSNSFAGDGIYVKAEPLSKDAAIVIYNLLKSVEIRGADAPTYIKVCLSLDRIIQGDDIVISVPKPEKEKEVENESKEEK